MRAKTRRVKGSSMGKKTSERLWIVLTILSAWIVTAAAQQATSLQTPPTDAIDQAQRAKSTAPVRPEETRTTHDRSSIFAAADAKPASDVSISQPKKGKVSGFDF